MALGDLFRVEGSAADGIVILDGDASRCRGIGAGLGSGTIRVAGGAGPLAGQGMSGGRLDIGGDAGDWLGAGMSGGVIAVGGSAGDDAAAALPAMATGMTGGLVIVGGDVGARAGARMRRGIVAVAGDCGPAAAFELRAGTLIVAGRLGEHPGLGMRRGSIVAAGPSRCPGVGFLRGARWSPPALRLLGRFLAAAGFPTGDGTAETLLDGHWRQWHGDSLSGGRGELFRRDDD